MFMKEVSANQSCIFLIRNTVRNNNTNIVKYYYNLK